MKKLVMIVVGIMLLTACNHDTLEQRNADRIAREQHRIAVAKKHLDQMLAETRACEGNGTVVNISTDQCYRDSCRTKTIHCSNGMNRTFKGDFLRVW